MERLIKSGLTFNPLLLGKTRRLIQYRLLRFRDFIFELFGIIGVVGVGVVAGIWIAEVLRQLTSRQYLRFNSPSASNSL